MRTLVFLAILHGSLLAQDTTRTISRGSVSVVTDPVGAEVFLDSVRIGLTPLDHVSTDSGAHTLRVFYPSSNVWNAFVKSEEVRVQSGTDVKVSYEFGSLLSIRSVPSGATVSYDGAGLGVTPLLLKSNRRLRGSLLLTKEQFEPATIGVSDSSVGVLFLKPLGAARDQSQEVTLEQPDISNPRMWATYGSAAGMVVSGVLAAYFKDQANKKFDLYLATKNNSYLSSTNRLDRQSAIALTFTEICFGVLSYLLFSD